MFPPFALIPRCLGKLLVEEASAILIAPVWSNQDWFPKILDCLASLPVLLPPLLETITNPHNRPHPLAVKGKFPWPCGRCPAVPCGRRNFRGRYINPQKLLEDINRVTYEVDRVLTFLESQPENEALPLQTLTHKLALLVALTIANRCSDLTAQTFPSGHSKRVGLCSPSQGLQRLGEMGHLHKNSTQSFAEVKSFVQSALKCYERRSKELRC